MGYSFEFIIFFRILWIFLDWKTHILRLVLHIFLIANIYSITDKGKNSLRFWIDFDGWWRNNLATRNKRNSIRRIRWTNEIYSNNKYDASSNGSNNQTVYILLDFFLSFYVSCWETELKKYRITYRIPYGIKIEFMYYVKLNHDAMIVVSKNKERKNVENCSRQKYRKVGRKKKKKDNDDN